MENPRWWPETGTQTDKYNRKEDYEHNFEGQIYVFGVTIQP